MTWLTRHWKVWWCECQLTETNHLQLQFFSNQNDGNIITRKLQDFLSRYCSSQDTPSSVTLPVCQRMVSDAPTKVGSHPLTGADHHKGIFSSSKKNTLEHGTCQLQRRRKWMTDYYDSSIWRCTFKGNYLIGILQ